jgi:regulator of sirC expression with transglutaminase-like and TPR domain
MKPGIMRNIPADYRLTLAFLVFLLIITFVAYRNLLNAEFLDYDDGGNVLQNEWIKDLSMKNIRAIFTTPVYYSYNPVTFITYAIEYRLFGMDSTWFHLTNILLHLVNILLVFRFVSLLANDKVIALVTASLFALHPIHVDVVGWISARNYLLCTFFFLLSLLFYIQYLTLSSGKTCRIIMSFLFFVLACLSKSQAVTLAPVILLINQFYKVKYDFRQIIIVALFFFISTATGLLTLYFRTDAGKAGIIPEYSFIEKTAVISYSFIKYIFKVICPFKLTAIDPFPGSQAGGTLPVMVYFAPFVIIAVFILMLKFLKKAFIISFGFSFFFLNILVSQISFLEDGFSANRYFYLPSTGIYMPLAMLGVFIYKKAASYKYLILTGGFILLALLAGITHSRAKEWKDTLSLTGSIIEKSPENAMGYNMRGISYYNQSEFELSIRDFNSAIALFPDYSSAYYNRGLSHAARQNYTAALKDHDRAIELNPVFISAYLARGVLFLDFLQDYNAALADFNKAVSLDPGNARAYYNRGLAYFRMRNVEEACKNWLKVKNLGYMQADQMIAKYCRQ